MEIHVLEENKIMTAFRSIFIEYQILKCIQATEKVKIFLGFDINTNENVKIIFIKLECGGTEMGYCSRTTHSLEMFKILSIINIRALPRISLNKKIGNYQVVVQYIKKGKELSEVNENQVMMAFRDVIKTIKILYNHKIRISDISHKNILIDVNNKVNLIDIDWMYFDESINEEYQKHHIRVLLRDFEKVLNSKNVSDKIRKKFEEMTKTATDNSVTLNFEAILKMNMVESMFNPILFVDPVVLSEIEELHFNGFKKELINNEKSKDFYIYRLVEENIVRKKFDDCYKSILTLRDQLKRKTSKNRDLCITLEEYSLFLLLKEKEEESYSIIKKRSALLTRMIRHSSYFYGCFNCINPGQDPYVEIDIFEPETLLNILKLIRINNARVIVTNNVIKIVAEEMKLSLIVKIKQRSNHSKIVFIKEYGREAEFVGLISELIENVRNLY